mmetsp:Transcript_27837/g.42834  ORF Transcript_27837/g.42834 Transcript_27837/m.42834 type:complete len:83 (+) Transcript_27837:715-963(+)
MNKLVESCTPCIISSFISVGGVGIWSGIEGVVAAVVESHLEVAGVVVVSLTVLQQSKSEPEFGLGGDAETTCDDTTNNLEKH